MVSDHGFKKTAKFTASGQARFVKISGEKNGKRRINIKDLGRLDQSFGAIHAIGRNPDDYAGYLKEPYIAVSGWMADPAVLCHVGLIEDVSRAQRQALHDPPEVDQRFNLGQIPQIPFQIGPD